MTYVRVTAIVAAAALIGSSAAAAATTPTQYRQRATAICKASSARLKAIEPPASKAELGRVLRQALPIFTTQYGALLKLSVPQSLRVQHLKALAAERAQLAGIRAAIAKLNGGADPTTTYNAMDKTLTPYGNAEDAAWRKLGVPACANLG
jgi:hypothetical protein